MMDDRPDPALQDVMRELKDVPETPRDAMWTEIQARRAERSRRRDGWLRVGRWGVGVAAILALGVGIGRMSTNGGGEPPRPTVASGDAAPDAGTIYRFAATEHLEQVESFLTMFRMDATVGLSIGDVGAPASELLSTTRLFLDSPASEDVKLRTLLEDIELVLAQIAQLKRDDRGELDLIDESIEQRGVLLRLQSLAGAQGAL